MATLNNAIPFFVPKSRLFYLPIFQFFCIGMTNEKMLQLSWELSLYWRISIKWQPSGTDTIKILVVSHKKDINLLKPPKFITHVLTMRILASRLIRLYLAPSNISSNKGLICISLLSLLKVFPIEEDSFSRFLLEPHFVLPFALSMPARILKARRNQNRVLLAAVVTETNRIWWVQIVSTDGVGGFHNGKNRKKSSWTQEMGCNLERSVEMTEDNQEHLCSWKKKHIMINDDKSSFNSPFISPFHDHRYPSPWKWILVKRAAFYKKWGKRPIYSMNIHTKLIRNARNASQKMK